MFAFDTERWDTADLFDASHPERLTATVEGNYLMFCNASFPTNGSGRRVMSIWLNGATIIAANGQQGDPGHHTDLSVSTLYRLAAGEYVEFHAAQDSGATLVAFGWPNPASSVECGMAKLS